ncbi:MAG TPA: penicillin-binding transpeptidase domain-containing protein [Polyangiales bacterium]
MFRASPRVMLSCALSAALVGSVIALAAADDQTVVESKPVRPAVPRAAAVTVRARALLAGFDPLVHSLQGEHFEARLAAGTRVELTLDVALQTRIEKLLADYAVPYGALVALDPQSGRVLAYVSHSSANPAAGDLARDATPPAASVFKIVTASALVDAGVTPDTQVCYGGGLSRLGTSDLEDDPRRDRACATLADALGGSINSVFAKLADRRLDAATLRRYADAYGFGRVLDFDVPVGPSPAEVPESRLEFARTAAGFWHMHMSPLHAALIAASVADAGLMPRATLVEHIFDAEGKALPSPRLEAPRRVVSEATARTVGKMMLRTVSDGTARSAFLDARRRSYLPGIEVAGKTGSLNADAPFRAYSWWVGFAPAQHPTIALAALIVNTPKWRIKSSFLAREALREYLVAAPERARRAEQKAAAARTREATAAAAPAAVEATSHIAAPTTPGAPQPAAPGTTGTTATAPR